MGRFKSWHRQPLVSPPQGVDPELWELFGGRSGDADPELLETSARLRLLLHEQAPPPADPAYRGRLRANLMHEARQRRGPVHRPRRLGLALGSTLGVAGLAMVALVLVSVLAMPWKTGPVQVRAVVAGQQRLAVTSAIRLSFNQPMDESAVDQGLKISPAVSYQASWPDPKTLVILPAHGLAPNVGYVVTIAQSDARAQNGAQASANIVIPFGTSPAPSAPAGQAPTVVSVTQEAVAAGATSIAYSPSGALLVLAAGGLQAPSPNSSAVASPSSSTAAGPTGSGALYLLTPSPREVANDAVGAVFSPDGQNVAYWAPQSNGTDELEVVAASGSGPPQTLAASSYSAPGLGWLDSTDLIYAAAGQLRRVSLDGAVSAVYPVVQLDPTGFFALSPSAQELFARPGGVPTIYSLPGGSGRALAGLDGLPTWSSSGSQLAYVVSGNGPQVIELSSDAGALSTVLLTAPAGIQLANLSFDPTGRYLAYTTTAAGRQAQLGAMNVQTQASASLGNLAGVSDPIWAPSGNQLSALVSVNGGAFQNVDTMLLAGTGQPLSGGDPRAALALSTATSLAQLQVADASNGLSEMTALLAAGADIAPSVLLPGKFDRFYAVSTTPTATGATSYNVDLRLVRKATSSASPAYLEELVTVQTQGATPVITAIAPGTLTPVPIGPLVVSASATTTAAGTTVFTIQFESDLNQYTAGPQSITVAVDGQAVSNLQFEYAPLTRTETVTAKSLPAGAVTLTVSAPLADVDNTPMQSAYQVALQPVPAATG